MTKVIGDLVECDCVEIHQLDPDGMSGCRWIHCDCGKKICKKCGSDNIEDLDRNLEADFLWCNTKCLNCGTVGCGECV
jgi:hypothetical protein